MNLNNNMDYLILSLLIFNVVYVSKVGSSKYRLSVNMIIIKKHKNVLFFFQNIKRQY